MITQQSEELVLTPPPEVSDHIDMSGLPEWVQEWIRSVCAAGRCVIPEFAITAVFQAVGAVVGNGAKLKTGEYRNPPLLWCSVIARSGFGKTKQHEIIMAPLLDIDLELSRKFENDRRTAAIEAEAKTPYHKRTFPEGVKKSCLIIKDSTPEARAARLQNSPNGCILYVDELAGTFCKFGQYSGNGGSEVSDLIGYWDNSPMKIDRKNDESSLSIPAPFLSIYGTLQPGRARQIFGDKSLWEQGFAQRWLFVYVTEKPGIRPKSVSVDKSLQARWRDFLLKLRKRHFGDDGIFRLTDGAENVYDEFCTRTENIENQEDDEDRAGIFSKARVNVLRLALVVQIIKDIDSEKVTRETMQYAVNCAWYYLSNSLKLYDDIFRRQCDEAAPPTKCTATDVVRYIMDHGQNRTADMAKILNLSIQHICRIKKKIAEERKNGVSLKKLWNEKINETPGKE